MGYDAVRSTIRHGAGRLKVSELQLTLRLWCYGHRRPRGLGLGVCARGGRVEREYAPVRRHSLGKERVFHREHVLWSDRGPSRNVPVRDTYETIGVECWTHIW